MEDRPGPKGTVNPTVALENQADAAANTSAVLTSQIQPQLAADQFAMGGLYQQYNANQANVGVQNAYAQSMAGIQQGQLGISEQQLALQGQGMTLSNQLAQQQQGYTQQQQDIQKQQYGIQYGPGGQAEQQQAAAVESMRGGQAATGAAATEGAKSQLGLQESGYQAMMQQAGLGQQSTLIGEQSQLAGYQAAQGGGQYGGGQAGLAQQNLSLMAKANGLSEQQLVEQLNYGISQNTNAGVVNAGQLLGQMGNLAAGEASTKATALAPIAYSAGINPLTPVGK